MPYQHYKLTPGTPDDLRTIYPDYSIIFPGIEQKSLEHLLKLMDDGHYYLWLLKHVSSGEIAGFALVYAPDSPAILWLDYLAVLPDKRDAGLGGFMLRELINIMKTSRSGMFLEVDIPDGQDPNADRRINFYHRFGAQRLDLNYIFPTPDGKGLPMHLFYLPFGNSPLPSAETVSVAIESAKAYIHRDISEAGSQKIEAGRRLTVALGEGEKIIISDSKLKIANY